LREINPSLILHLNDFENRERFEGVIFPLDFMEILTGSLNLRMTEKEKYCLQ